jgi:hypothetical protein
MLNFFSAVFIIGKTFFNFSKPSIAFHHHYRYSVSRLRILVLLNPTNRNGVSAGYGSSRFPTFCHYVTIVSDLLEMVQNQLL